MIVLRPAPAALPRGRRIYAIGDIHGSIAQLRDLHGQIAADLRDRPVASALLIHLGDYVDKGGDSRAVLDHLIEADPVPGLDTLNLMGNHEPRRIGCGAAAAPRSTPGACRPTRRRRSGRSTSRPSTCASCAGCICTTRRVATSSSMPASARG